MALSPLEVGPVSEISSNSRSQQSRHQLGEYSAMKCQRFVDIACVVVEASFDRRLASRQQLAAATAHPQHARNRFCARKSEIRGGANSSSASSCGDQVFLRVRSPCSINFQNSRAFPADRPRAMGSLLRKRKSRNVFLCRTRWTVIPSGRLFKINPVIFGAIAMQFFTLALDHTEPAAIQMIKVLPAKSEIQRAGRAAKSLVKPTFPPRSVR